MTLQEHLDSLSEQLDQIYIGSSRNAIKDFLLQSNQDTLRLVVKYLDWKSFGLGNTPHDSDVLSEIEKRLSELNSVIK